MAFRVHKMTFNYSYKNVLMFWSVHTIIWQSIMQNI